MCARSCRSPSGIVVLFVGKTLNQRFTVLREYNIPEPVTGGLLFSIAIRRGVSLSGVKVDFDLTARDVLLVYFFTVIGINAQDRRSRAGREAACARSSRSPWPSCSWRTSSASAQPALGLDPAVGLLAGSISMTGGHGTAIAWAPVIAETRGVANADGDRRRMRDDGARPREPCRGTGRSLPDRAPPARGAARQLSRRRCATRGAASPDRLLLVPARASLPSTSPRSSVSLAHRWLEKRRRQGAAVSPMPRRRDPSHEPAAARLAVRRLAEPHGRARAHRGGLAGRLPRDVADEHEALDARRTSPGRSPCCSRCSSRSRCYSRSLFASGLLDGATTRQWCQAGFIGIGLGATPTAMANMTAVTQRHGPSHLAFLVVPLVGAFFIDIANALIIKFYLAII